MGGARQSPDAWHWTVEFRIAWTSVVPESPPIGHRIQTKDFLDAAIAVRTHDEDVPIDLGWTMLEAHDDIVVKLALLPMIDVFPAVRAQYVEESFQAQRVGQLLQHGGSISAQLTVRLTRAKTSGAGT
jgi:hypothetical protein